MLESSFYFSGNIKNAYKIKCFKDYGYEKSKNRFLIVIGHIPTIDLKNNSLLSCTETREPLISSLKKARDLLDDRGVDYPSFSYACVNFLASKHYHLEGTAKSDKENEFVGRIKALIKELSPTHVMILSPLAFECMFPEIDHQRHKLGWIFEKKGIKYCGSLDLYQIIADQNKKPGSNISNTIGFMFNHIANLMQGQNPYSLEGLPLSPNYIDSVEKFDNLMNYLETQDYVALDTETRNLTVLSNAIYTIQFAGNSQPNKGFLLALDHPQTPWTSEELRYFKKRLRKFFASSSGPTLVTYNGAFDLYVIRQALKLPIVGKRVWEIMAGEHLLDENVNDLSDAIGSYRSDKTKANQGNLRATLCRYNNDFYFRDSGFTKEDRNTAGDISPKDRDFVSYGCMDVVSLLGLRKMQIKRASHMFIGDKNYKEAFIKHMLYQMSDTVHTLSQLRQDGSFIDLKNLSFLLSNKSPILEKLSDVETDLRIQPEVEEANDFLCKQLGFNSGNLFGNKLKKWVFSWTKPIHKSTLFFDIMKMKPVSETSTGAPAVDKLFIAQYENTNRIVSLFKEYQKINKVRTSYLKSWFSLLSSNPDCILDHKLRPDYAFYNVTTGRLASRNPSLQTIPQHSDISDILKRVFSAPPGCILLHYDYSAQEVRTWGIVSHDAKIADTFRQGQTLRKIFIKDPSPENLDNVKKKGDVHILNVKLFFNKVIDKKDPLRHAIKAVVFGTLYGKGAKTLGEDTKQPDISALRKKIKELFFKLDNLQNPKERQPFEKELNILKKDLDKLVKEDKTDYAQHIIDKMFSIFTKGKKWSDYMKHSAEKRGYVYSPIGRIRHLPSVFISDKSGIAKQIRRGSNAPIQGFASEIAVKASRLSLMTYYKEFKTIASMLGIEQRAWELKPECCRIVHDASYYAIPYCMVLPFLHIMQYMATYGVAQDYKDKFGFSFNIEPEIEVEMGVKDDKAYTWNWSLEHLHECLNNLVDDLEKEKKLVDRNGKALSKEEVKEMIFKPYKDKKVIHYLQSKFPLLGVNDLEKEIFDVFNRPDHSY